jgi:hypothetical protein
MRYPAFLTRRVNEFVALASWPAVAWVSRPTPDTVCSVTVCANGMNERGFDLAARTLPVQPTRRSALQSVDLAVRNAGSPGLKGGHQTPPLQIRMPVILQSRDFER